MVGTRDFALLRSGIREIVTLKSRKCEIRDFWRRNFLNKLNFRCQQRLKRPEISTALTRILCDPYRVIFVVNFDRNKIHKLWKCCQRRQPIGRRTILQIMVSCTRTRHVSLVSLIQSMRDWAPTFGAAARQRSVRQQTTMATVGTLPSYLYHREVQLGDSVSLEPAEPSARQMRGTKQEMKTTKKAFLSTIRLAAIKIQKNSHLVMTRTKRWQWCWWHSIFGLRG